MNKATLDTEILGVRHFGYLVPEFSDRERGIGEHAGRIIVLRHGSSICRTRPPGEVTGWRLACRCDRVRKEQPAVAPWMGEQLWARVVDPKEHDPFEYRVYAPDELTVDVAELQDVGDAARYVWEQNHLQDWWTLSYLVAAIQSLKAARREFDSAVKAAKDTALVEPRVLASMGLRSDQIESLNLVLGGATDG